MAQPKKPRQKQIKLKDIQKTYQQMNTYKTHILNEEQNLTIKYYETFDEIRIQELMKEAYSNLLHDAEHNLGFFKNDALFIQYIYFLILKHFTNLKSEISETLSEQIPIFNQIISIGLFEEMFNSVFPPGQVSIVLERVSNFATLAQQVTELESETRQKASETVIHPLMKKKLKEGKSDAKV